MRSLESTLSARHFSSMCFCRASRVMHENRDVSGQLSKLGMAEGSKHVFSGMQTRNKQRMQSREAPHTCASRFATSSRLAAPALSAASCRARACSSSAAAACVCMRAVQSLGSNAVSAQGVGAVARSPVQVLAPQSHSEVPPGQHPARRGQQQAPNAKLSRRRRRASSAAQLLPQQRMRHRPAKTRVLG